MTISPTTTNQLYSYLSGGTQSSSTPSFLTDLSSAQTATTTDATQSMLSKLQPQSSTLGSDLQNGNNAIGMIQIAQKALSALTTDTKQLNTISTQLSNTSLSSDQQTKLQQEANSLTQSMQKTLTAATFNGKSVFGNSSFTIGGSTLSAGVAAPDLSKLDISNSQSISDFSKSLSTSQSNLGSQVISVSNSMMGSLTQNLMQTLTGSNSNGTDNIDFNSSYMSLQQNAMTLSAQSISQSHNTTALQSSINTLLA